MTEGMKRSALYILTGIAALVLCTCVCSAGFAPEFEMIPFSMKEPSADQPYNDEAFKAEADSLVQKTLNSTVPTGTTLSEISDGYYRLIMENVSPEFLDFANNIVGYLYYTSKAGATYEDFHEYVNSVSKSTDGSEYYTIADQYRQVAAEFWNRIKDKYPNATMYTLPDANDPMPEEVESTGGNTLKGLQTELPMELKKPDPNSPDQTEDVKKLTIRWFEDYVDAAEADEIDPLTKKVVESAGQKFMKGEGLEWVDSTYMDIIGKNVADNFYEKAQYISAFFYLLSQARDSYEDYTDDRTFISSVSNGEENYEKAKKYYTEANNSITYFNDIIPNGTNSSLPDFPKFGEVKIASSAWDEYGEIGYITTSMAEELGYNDDTE